MGRTFFTREATAFLNADRRGPVGIHSTCTLDAPCQHKVCRASCFAGPFASSVGVGRAEPEWAALNLVTSQIGTDAIADSGEISEAPLDLGPVRFTCLSPLCVAHE